MELAVKPIHDFLAFLACLAIGIAVSFTQPLLVSLGVFILCYALWLLVTSPFARAEHRAALKPGVSRASLGGILLVVSVVVISSHVRLEPRLTALIVIVVLASLTLYVYALSRKTR